MGGGTDCDSRCGGIHKDPRHPLVPALLVNSYIHTDLVFQTELCPHTITTYMKRKTFLVVVFRFRDLFPQQLQTFYLEDIRVMMAEPGDFEIIAGVGNEVFYFFGIYPFS